MRISSFLVWAVIEVLGRVAIFFWLECVVQTFRTCDLRHIGSSQYQLISPI